MEYIVRLVKRPKPKIEIWVGCLHCFKSFWIYSWGQTVCPHCKALLDYRPHEEEK